MLFPTTALKKNNKCKTQTGGKDESRWACPPLRRAGIDWEGLPLWLCSPLASLPCFSILLSQPSPWRFCEMAADGAERNLIASALGSFLRGQDALVIWLSRKKPSALTARLGWAAAPGRQHSSALLLPSPACCLPGGLPGIFLGPDPDGRGIIAAAQGRTQPGLVWLLFLGRQLLGREPVPRPCLPALLHSRLEWSVMTGRLGDVCAVEGWECWASLTLQ